MKPFEKATNEIANGNALVRRSTFLRILKRIAELSGVQLAPLSRASETPSGASYALSPSGNRKQWGVSFVGEWLVKVGYGCVMVDGKQGYEILSSTGLTVGASGYVGISVTSEFVIGPPAAAPEDRAEWMGWVEITGSPSLEFKSSPPSSEVSSNYASKSSTPKEIFVPIAYIENGSVTNLIRDGITIRLATQGFFPQPLYIIALT